jgi:hypothetical protein
MKTKSIEGKTWVRLDENLYRVFGAIFFAGLIVGVLL